jgi:hypothetical protein
VGLAEAAISCVVLEGYKLEALDVFLTVVELLGLPIV